MMLELLDEAVAAGARLTKACALVNLSVRTVQRWRAENGGEDRRRCQEFCVRRKVGDMKGIAHAERPD